MNDSKKIMVFTVKEFLDAIKDLDSDQEILWIDSEEIAFTLSESIVKKFRYLSTLFIFISPFSINELRRRGKLK